jgi:hypothetical protein
MPCHGDVGGSGRGLCQPRPSRQTLRTGSTVRAAPSASSVRVCCLDQQFGRRGIHPHPQVGHRHIEVDASAINSTSRTSGAISCSSYSVGIRLDRGRGTALRPPPSCLNPKAPICGRRRRGRDRTGQGAGPGVTSSPRDERA